MGIIEHQRNELAKWTHALFKSEGGAIYSLAESGGVYCMWLCSNTQYAFRKKKKKQVNNINRILVIWITGGLWEG